MYEDVVTLFNRKVTDAGVLWYPTVIEGVHVAPESVAAEAGYGRARDDRAAVLIPYVWAGGAPCVGGKTYVPPKLWQKVEEPAAYVTFAGGEDFDFFITENWLGTEPVEDGAWPGGFYGYLAGQRDNVFAVTAVSRYKALPHFEVTGR